MKIIIYISILMFGLADLFAQSISPSTESSNEITQIEKEISVVDFDAIKNILQKDKLDQSVQNKQNEVNTIQEEREKKKLQLYHYPSESDFWSFASELWLVRNAPLLKWDFNKPDYGIDISFQTVLETIGYYEKKFHVLLVNTPTLSHIALPTNNDETLFIISVPFIRTMDLTKLEISILMLEDFFRLEKGYLYQFVKTSELVEIFGKNFYDKGVNPAVVNQVLKKYSELIFQKGFNFQQQFEVTKRMDSVLRSHLKLWGAYNTLLNKIDQLVKTNLLYDNYNRIYPSPEMQIKWLTPKAPLI